MSGLAEILARRASALNLAELADELGLDVDDLFPLVDGLDLLGFANVDTADGTLRPGFFRDLLAHHDTTEQVTQQLETATGWGRYAELYTYDAYHEEYRLDPALTRPPRPVG